MLGLHPRGHWFDPSTAHAQKGEPVRRSNALRALTDRWTIAMPASPQRMAYAELCGKWMPKAGAFCARQPGHNGYCMSPASMERNRKYNRARRASGLRESPELRRKHNRKYRITSYGITLEQFNRLLEAQDNSCGMCHAPFEDGQLIRVDHDHACCPEKSRSCGECVRGLLCHACNIALGHIERRYALARVYLNSSYLSGLPQLG